MKKYISILLLSLLFYSCESFLVETTYWPNGNIESKSSYLEEEEHGKKLYAYQRYYENGAIQAEGFLLGKVYHGEWKEYYLNGQLLRNGHYHEGLARANFTEYHANGQLRAKYRYNKASQLQGKYQVFDLKGDALIDGQYHEGEKHGKWMYQYNKWELIKMGEEDSSEGLGLTSLHRTPDPIEKKLVSYWSYYIGEQGYIGIVNSKPPQIPAHLDHKALAHKFNKNRLKKGPEFLGPVKKETDLQSSKKIVEYGDLGAQLHAYWENGEEIIKEGSGVIRRKALLESGPYHVLREISYDYIGGYPLGSRYHDLEYYSQ
ncbi:MAG: hypothetical protein R8P61_06170 [Bacteroidia bacterium]|nr:hypothetical protein [Bacteroidia bacterium]